MFRNTAVPFDDNAIGPSLALSNSNTTLATSATVDAHRMCRSQYAASQQSSVEFYVYSPNGSNPAVTGTPPPVTLGVVNGLASLTDYVGADANGWGLDASGNVWHNGAILTTFASGFTLSSYVTVVIDPTIGALCFKVGKQVLGVINIGASVVVYYAGSVSGNAQDLAIDSNAGQLPFQDSSGTAASGWLHTKIGITPLFLATEPFIATPADEKPNQKYYGDLTRSGSTGLNIGRRIKPWPWGPSAELAFGFDNSTLVQIPIDDPLHLYDELYNARDQLVRIRRTLQYTSLAAAEDLFSGVIDRCEPNGNQKKTLYVGGKSLLLDKQPLRARFAPDADPSIAGKFRPLTLGVRRTLRATLISQSNRSYAWSDAPESAVGKLRVAGKEIALGIDAAATPDVEGCTLVADPTGPFTVEVTDYGGVYTTSSTDALAGSGVFGSIAAQGNGQPTGWTGNGGYGSQDAANTLFQVNGASPNKFVRQAQKAFAVYTLKHNTYTLAAGTSYSLRVNFNQVPWYGVGVDVNGDPLTILPAVLVVGGYPNSDSNGMIQFFNFARTQLTATGAVILTVTNTQTVAVPLVIGLLCNAMLQGWNGHFSYFDISDIEIVPLPALLQNVALADPPLDYMLRKLYIDRGPLREQDYDGTGAQAIDAATGYGYGCHATPNDTPSIAKLAKTLLDSCCGDDYDARDGRVSTMRLWPPETATSVAGTLTVTDQVRQQGQDGTSIIRYDDFAENLTDGASGCPNCDPLTDSDFSNVTTNDVPMPVRQLLKQPYQWTVRSKAPLDPQYDHARGALPLQTQFDQETDGEAEITRVCGELYSVPRAFYTGPFFMQMGRKFELDEVWFVVDPEVKGLEDGKLLLIVGVLDINEISARPVFWG